jgi:carbon storage regulator
MLFNIAYNANIKYEYNKEPSMLVLSRRTNETLVIDNNIRFTVLSVHGNQVRIGIEAPDDIIILREEIIANTQRAPAAPSARDNTLLAEIKTEAPAPTSKQSVPHAHGDQRGGEQGKRRGVLGLRRRRP